ncbi:MAG TPA: kelch repeat-containing protein, partial [Candidatus Acidoferrum sp.]|nr:kelch repeat-containing protein [Candidatus Acidoferrum sp.]
MNVARENHTAILLPNGQVLVTGGFGSSGSSGFIGSSEVYDPVTGRWTLAGILVTAREYHTTSLLPNGKILAAAGEDSSFGPIASAELYDIGLGFSSSWQPALTLVPPSVSLGAELAMAGSLFRGISGGSCGNSQDSPGDAPALQLRSLQTDQIIIVPPAAWTSNSFTSMPVSGLPVGHVLATVYVNGIPSASAVVQVQAATIVVYGTRLGNGDFQLSLTYATGTSFSALMSSNVTTALSNWTVLGSVTETLPGQYQFTDTQAATQPRRFYRIRSP